MVVSDRGPQASAADAGTSSPGEVCRFARAFGNPAVPKKCAAGRINCFGFPFYPGGFCVCGFVNALSPHLQNGANLPKSFRKEKPCCVPAVAATGRRRKSAVIVATRFESGVSHGKKAGVFAETASLRRQSRFLDGPEQDARGLPALTVIWQK